MATAKMQTGGFKTAVHKPMGDVTTATSIISTAYGTDLLLREVSSHTHENYVNNDEDKLNVNRKQICL